MSPTRNLALFSAGLSFETLPEEVIHKAKLCLLDYLANIYGSLQLEAAQAVVEHVRSLGGPETCTALGCGFKTGLQNAAFINGTTAEAIEAQDGYRFGGNHPVSAVIPAVLAVAEAEGAGGGKVIEAIVAGYEVANRAAAAVHPGHTVSGFLPTGTCGTFGAAAAVARLLDFSADETLNAIGNAGYLLPLSMAEELMGGYTIKIVQGGQAASAGIMAAGLAGKGITGCPEIIEGSSLSGGFIQITNTMKSDVNKLAHELGRHFTIADIYFKPYTSCRHTHGAAQAALELARKHSIEAAAIDSVTVHTYTLGAIAAGKGVAEGGSFVSAQFSIPYVTAVALLDGELGPGQLTGQRMKDKELMELVGRVKVVQDEELSSCYPEVTASRVGVKLRSGELLEKLVEVPKGDPRDPMTEEDLVKKVERFSGSRDGEKVKRVIELIMKLETASNISEMASLI